MSVQTFSGAHPFAPQHLVQVGVGVDDLEVLVRRIDDGKCPRCTGDLLRFEGELPTGSRVTRCRCVPVCAPCGADEASNPVKPKRWAAHPVDADAIRATFERLSEEGTEGILSGDTLVTDQGVTKLVPREHPGGWAEFGWTDDADREERER